MAKVCKAPSFPMVSVSSVRDLRIDLAQRFRAGVPNSIYQEFRTAVLEASEVRSRYLGCDSSRRSKKETRLDIG